jgi:DNA-binding GntR family transcriptional regulator
VRSTRVRWFPILALVFIATLINYLDRAVFSIARPLFTKELGIPVLFPVMHMKRVMFTTNDKPLELVETLYRADKYHYSVNLVRIRRGTAWRWRTEVETSA